VAEAQARKSCAPGESIEGGSLVDWRLLGRRSRRRRRRRSRRRRKKKGRRLRPRHSVEERLDLLGGQKSSQVQRHLAGISAAHA
jgi:hypothetical protein